MFFGKLTKYIQVVQIYMNGEVVFFIDEANFT